MSSRLLLFAVPYIATLEFLSICMSCSVSWLPSNTALSTCYYSVLLSLGELCDGILGLSDLRFGEMSSSPSYGVSPTPSSESRRSSSSFSYILCLTVNWKVSFNMVFILSCCPKSWELLQNESAKRICYMDMRPEFNCPPNTSRL